MIGRQHYLKLKEDTNFQHTQEIITGTDVDNIPKDAVKIIINITTTQENALEQSTPYQQISKMYFTIL